MAKLGESQLVRLFSDIDRKPLTDNQMRTLIISLWRDYLGLYNEKFLRRPIDPEDPKQIWIKNIISEDINFGQAIGQNHLIEGNRSAAFGQGAATKSFLETVLGTYNLIPEGQNAEEWIPTDLLLTLGNGPDAAHRSNVFEILKNGFFKFLQSIKIGPHPVLAEGQTPEDGTLQWTPEAGLEIWDGDSWEPVGQGDDDHVTEIALVNHSFIVGDCIKRSASTWIKAKADTRANAGTLGIVCEVIDADHFKYRHGGILPGTFVDGADYFLSPDNAGAIFIQSDPEVWEIGQIREFIGSGTPEGLLVEIDLGDEISPEFLFPDVETAMSITGNGTQELPVKLVNDQLSPEPLKYYGTNEAAQRGYHLLPTEAVQNLSGLTPEFNLNLGRGAKIVLTGNTTIIFSNLKSNDTGHIKITQDALGGRTLSFAGATIQIAFNSYKAASEVKLTGIAASHDIIAYWYDGSVMNLAVIYNISL